MAGVDAGGGDPAGDEPKLTVRELSRESDVVTIEVAGQLDLATEAVLRDILGDAIERGPSKIVLEVSGLDFMDSSGLAALLIAAREVDVVELVNPTAVIRRLIAAAGLGETLRMTPDG